jgi:hypothetical protein
MKIVRVKYIPPLGPLIQDLQRVFPQYTITAQFLDSQGGILIDTEKKRFVYVKEFRDEVGTRTKVIVYMLARDTFQVPNWVQGTVLAEIDLATEPIDHWFMGHEIPVPDNSNETPDDLI